MRRDGGAVRRALVWLVVGGAWLLFVWCVAVTVAGMSDQLVTP